MSEADLSAILASSRLVVVAFSSPWCAPCRAVERALDAELPGHPAIARAHVDIATEPATATRYGIRSTPTLIGFADGKPVATAVGWAGPHGLKRFLRDLTERA
ncbi:MAG: thioredoxin family protein [Alphaproteobacteria bacterium]|nr:thioredoxin family protein [Alphaproteobacteria bacterium]